MAQRRNARFTIAGKNIRHASGFGVATTVPYEGAFVAGDGPAGDVMVLAELRDGMILKGYRFEVVGTLGAGVTVQPVVGVEGAYRALGPASTAGQANNLADTIADLASLAGPGRVLGLLVAGGAVAAGTTVRGHFTHYPR